MLGVVIEFKRRFGFILPDGCDRTHHAHFFHIDELPTGVSAAQLTLGSRVEFDSVNSPRGLRAENVRPMTPH